MAPAGRPRRPVPHPTIAIAGLGIEASVFSPARTDAAAFRPLRGDAVLTRYPFLAPGRPLRAAADWRGALVGKALPGGVVTAAAFAELSAELLDRLAGLGPLDGLLFDIHGAMTVDGLTDAEAVLLDRIRGAVGTDPIVSTAMDLHGNVSRRLAHLTDLITCYRTAPHVDADATRERAARNLVSILTTGAPRPVKAWVPVPVLLPGEMTSTRDDPARRIYGAIPEVAAADGVLDAAIWVGYAWGDEPRNRAAVVATGPSRAAVTAAAERLAGEYWAARREFAFVAPTGSLAECLDAAVRSADRPFFVSDSGDNPTAGGAGDVTWSLARILASPPFQDPAGPRTIYAALPGPAAVAAAAAAGVGATVTVAAGAQVDATHAGPLTMTGTVRAVRVGDPDAGVEAVLRVGAVDVVLTERRKPYHYERDFTDLGLDPRHADVVVVKIGYLEPELFAMARGWLLARTPGGVDQDLLRLGHRRLGRPMFPFDPDMATPDLTARVVPPVDEPLGAPPGPGD